jgi:hypothetical protein
MAIPRSKLSDFISSSKSPNDILARLREAGLLLDNIPEGEILSRIQEAFAEEADEHAKYGLTWASAETRIPSKLIEYLSKKGRKWASNH